MKLVGDDRGYSRYRSTLFSPVRLQLKGRAVLKVPMAVDCTVDRSAFIYLMDLDKKYLGFRPPGTSAERMATAILEARMIAIGARHRRGAWIDCADYTASRLIAA